jgi:hypothetical protein
MSAALQPSQLRIAALWAFSEAFLGGILHGLQLPFTGLILSAFAAICMCALALKDYKRGKILHATLLVMIVKLTLSPHTPFTAYFAVLLQGCCAELLFACNVPYGIASYATAVFALMQSAFQQLIVLTVLFGMEGWKALDEFLNGVLETFSVEKTPYTLYIVSGYLLLHLLAGIAAGRFASRLQRLQPWDKPVDFKRNSLSIDAGKKRSAAATLFYWIVFIMLAALIYQVYAKEDFLSWITGKPLKLLFRAALIMVFWYFFLSPVIMRLLKQWLLKRKDAFSAEVEDILLLLPAMKAMVLYAWMLSGQHRGLKRVAGFINYCFRLLITSV